MAENGQPMVRVSNILYIVQFDLQKQAYMGYEGHIEKYRQDRAFSTTYEFHTPDGIKRVKYSDTNLKIYIPLDVYDATEKKIRTKAASYKEHKTLESYQYADLVTYFPDEKDKWKRVEETKVEWGGYGDERVVVVKYERISQDGGRRKQAKKLSRKAKRRANSTRRR